MSAKKIYTQEQLNNYSKQLNYEDDAFWQSRGKLKRPDDWRTRQHSELKSN